MYDGANSQRRCYPPYRPSRAKRAPGAQAFIDLRKSELVLVLPSLLNGQTQPEPYLGPNDVGEALRGQIGAHKLLEILAPDQIGQGLLQHSLERRLHQLTPVGLRPLIDKTLLQP